jgi:hypothetical protein
MASSPSIASIISLLKIGVPGGAKYLCLTPDGWEILLASTDENHLTLFLGTHLGDGVPDWVKSRVSNNLADNSSRFQKIKQTYVEIADSLKKKRIEHVVLKGFTQLPGYPRDPRLRMQSDIDLYCPPCEGKRALEALKRLGYVPADWAQHISSPLHFPAMVREHKYVWRGNYFDPAMPLSIDLHTRLWNADAYHIGPQELDGFWERRVIADLDEIEFPVLHPVDAIGFAALHALRHVLLNSLLVGHIYEIACLLDMTYQDRNLWTSWKAWHGTGLRQAEAVVFYIAREWFRCRTSDEINAELEVLPSRVRWWLSRYINSSGGNWNAKEAVWLQMGLADPSKKWMILRAGLLGGRSQGRESFLAATTQTPNAIDSLKSRAFYTGYLARRGCYHACTLPGTLWNGLNYWRAKTADSR